MPMLTTVPFRRRAIAISFGACLLAASALAQPYYPNMQYGPKQELAPGVTWQELSNPNPLWKIDVFEIDMTSRNVHLMPVFKNAGNVAGTPNERTSAMAVRTDAIAAVNAGYYDTSNFMTNSYTVIDGQLIGGSSTLMRPENNRSILGFSGNHQAIPKRTKVRNTFIPHDTVDWEKIIDFIAGRGHFITANGVVVTQDNESTGESHYGARHPRTLIGYTADPYKAYLVTIDGRQASYSVGMTYEECAKLMADLGVEQSVSLDGGGSTTAWVKGKGIVNSPSDVSERSVVSAWVVLEANTVDNSVEEVTVTGGWTTDSAHDEKYYLDSLVSSNEDAPGSVTWTPDFTRSGLYKVYAWWTSDAGRTTEAPYVIHSLLDTTTIRVDQTQNGGRWNLLGTFGFDEGTAGSVALHNSAPGTVSADAIRFVRVGDAPTVVPVDYVVTGTLYENDFEADSSGDFAVVHRNVSDNAVDFSYDYSTFSQAGGGIPASIPASPRTTGDGTRALRMAVNLAAGTPNAVTATLTAIEPRENMRITFDGWINYNGGTGGTSNSTEFLTFGGSANPALYAHTSTAYTHPAAANQPFNGFFFAIAGEGGSAQDYRYYDGSGTGGATGNNGPLANFLGTGAVDHPDFTSVFPKPPFETAGAPGKQWLRWEVLVLDGKVRLIVTREDLSQILLCDWFTPNATATMADLLPHFGTTDPLATAANPASDNFVLIDNLRVESISAMTVPGEMRDSWAIY
jgi:hypothetical protein